VDVDEDNNSEIMTSNAETHPATSLLKCGMVILFASFLSKGSLYLNLVQTDSDRPPVAAVWGSALVKVAGCS
jgi:hypothetical protein